MVRNWTTTPPASSNSRGLVQNLLGNVPKVAVNQALGGFWTFWLLWDSRDVAVIAAGGAHLGVLCRGLGGSSRSCWGNQHLVRSTLFVNIFRWLCGPPLHDHLLTLLVLGHVHLVGRLFTPAVAIVGTVSSREDLAVDPTRGVLTLGHRG